MTEPDHANIYIREQQSCMSCMAGGLHTSLVNILDNNYVTESITAYAAPAAGG